MDFNDISRLSEEQARKYLESLCWPDGAECPHCNSKNVASLQNKASGNRKRREGLYSCRDCRKQFTVTVGTIFEGARIPIRTWLLAFSLMFASKKGISSHQLHRMLGITYKSAWFMSMRVRHAMAKEPLVGMLSGKVEADETYVGGKIGNMSNYQRRKIRKTGSRFDNKTPVLALVERDGNVRTRVVANVTSKNLKTFLTENIAKKSTLYTDEFRGYKNIGKEFSKHRTVMHNIHQYVKGDASINSAESFFSLLKRGVTGSFHHISPEHLQRYSDEFSWRWNRRKVSDEERTINTLKMIEGAKMYYRDPLRKAS